MAMRKVCDVCESNYEAAHGTEINVLFREEDGAREIDICSKCEDKVLNKTVKLDPDLKKIMQKGILLTLIDKNKVDPISASSMMSGEIKSTKTKAEKHDKTGE